MAQREMQAGNEYSSMSAFFNQIGCIALIVYTYNHLRYPNLYEMAVWFAVPMMVSLALQLVLMISMMRAQRN